ncbi:hypothetical protein Tco_0359702 [Tanacetum coccineum]
MASLLAKRVASNLLRIRTIASSSRFFSTKGYEYVQHDFKDECILKYDDKNASSLVRGVVECGGGRQSPLHIPGDMSEGFNQDVKELVPNKESMFRIDEKNVEESGPNKESMTWKRREKCLRTPFQFQRRRLCPEPYWIKVKESVLPNRNVFLVIDI